MKKTNEDFLSELSEKNPTIRPLELYRGSKEKIFCQCMMCGHKWSVAPSNLLSGKGCPKCSGRYTKTNDEFLNELRSIHPEIESLEEYKGVDHKIKFRCRQCGNEWSTTPYDILKSKSGCTKCARVEMARKRTKSTEQFIKEMNEINPDILIIGEYTKARKGILCECVKCGYTWSPSPTNLLKGKGCPSCAGIIRKTNEEFLDELGKVNPNITPIEVYVNYNTPIKVQCVKCNYVWKVSPASLLSLKTGCPKCAGVYTKTNDEFMKELRSRHPSITSLEEYKGTDKPIRFRCNDCGYEWITTPYNILRAEKPCRQCANRYSENKEDRVKEFAERVQKIHPEIILLSDYKSAHDKVRIKCSICGSEYEKKADTLLRTKHACRNCNRYMQTSFPEQALLYYIRKAYPNAINGYKDGFGKMELDIYIPEIKTAIEYDGERWHRGSRSDNKEKKKYELCQKNKIKLIRVKECINNVDNFNCDSLYTIEPEPDDESLGKLIATLLDKEFDITFDISLKNDRISILEKYQNIKHEKSLAYKNPELAAEWHPTKNGYLHPENVAVSSGEKVWWLCKKCGNEWEAVIASRNAGVGCPRCFDNKRKEAVGLRFTNEEFIEKLSKINPMITPLDSYKNAQTKILVKCNNCGNTWRVRPYSLLSQQTGCPFCAGKMKKTNEQFTTELKSKHPNISVLDEYVNYETAIAFVCGNCGRTFSATPHQIMSRKNGCLYCRNREKQKY